jgi:hypothetical protein
MINPSDSTSVVKEQIEDAVSLAGYSAPTSWTDATDKINGTADQFERDQIADGMNGGVARGRINALFDGPVWAPEGASLTIDFAANKAWTRNNAVTDSVDAVDLTRAGSVLMLGPDGYEEFAAGELARIDGIGAQVAPARANKCENWNANPVDLTGVSKSGDAASVLSVVDDSAALVAAGLSNICTSGMVYKLDNSAGTTNAIAQFSGGTGNTNSHVVSAFMRGSGIAKPQLSAVGASNATMTNDYMRIDRAITPTAGTNLMTILASPGAVVYFILNQLEEGSFATPPIITTGAAASRAGDLLTADLTGKLEYGVAGFIKVDIKHPSVASTFPRIFEFNNGAGSSVTRLSISRSASGTIRLAQIDGGTTRASLDLGAWTLGERTIAFAFSNGFAAGGIVGGNVFTAAPTVYVAPTSLGVGGVGFTTNDNAFQINQKLALFYGSPSKPINQSFFDEVYAKAVEA